MTDKYLNKYLMCDNIAYCAYCGQELKRKEVYDHYDIGAEFYCDCADAKKEREIMSQVYRLERDLPRVKYQVKPQVTELKEW